MAEYDDLLAEATATAEAFRTTAKNYIPRMYVALRNENPNISPTDATDRIKKDCIKIWSKHTIIDALPDEAKDPKKQKAGRLGQKKQYSAAFSAAPKHQKVRKELVIEAKGTSLIEEESSSRDHQTNYNTESDSDASSTFDAKEDVQWSRLGMEGNVPSDLGSEKQTELLKKQVEDLQARHVQDTERITELEAALANNNEADSQAILPDEHHEKSIAERDANYNGLSNPQLMVLIRQRDEQIIDLHEKDTQNINKITELQAALAQTSFTLADQMPKTEVKEVGVDLEKFGALLLAAIRNRKKRCSIQIDQTGNAIGLRTAAEEINEVKGLNE